MDFETICAYLNSFNERIGPLCYNRPFLILGIYGSFLPHWERGGGST